jgi:alpha-acetolactate decarboxylase
MLRLSLGLFLVAAVAVDPAQSPRTFGTIPQLVRQRDAQPKVDLAEVLREPHAYGLGSLSDLRGEITILDGAAWLSYPPARTGDRPRVVESRKSHESAAFLVVARAAPAEWRQVQIADGLTSERFEAILASILRRQGLSGTALPFRVDGRFSALTLAIADGRKLPPGPGSEEIMKQANFLEEVSDPQGVDGTLVGFYEPDSDGRFTHAGTHTHVHAIVPARRATGHAQAFTIASGATLWLPAHP